MADKVQNQHYIPEWLLKRFSPLHELDIHTLTIEKRATKTGGSEKNIWPVAIEDGVMRELDNAAARIFRYPPTGRQRFTLSPTDRTTVAQWIALFYTRSPRLSEHFRSVVSSAINDPQIVVDQLRASGHELAEQMRKVAPNDYVAVVEELGSEQAAEEWIVSQLSEVAKKEPARFVPNPTAAYHQYLGTCKDNIELVAGILASEFHWTWLYSQYSFVIGDSPLVRWHEQTQQFDYGIKHHVEITMPLSSSLCLLMTRRPGKETGLIVNCPRRQTREFNRRQRLAAIKHLYAGDPALLNENARYALRAPRRK